MDTAVTGDHIRCPAAYAVLTCSRLESSNHFRMRGHTQVVVGAKGNQLLAIQLLDRRTQAFTQQALAYQTFRLTLLHALAQAGTPVVPREDHWGMIGAHGYLIRPGRTVPVRRVVLRIRAKHLQAASPACGTAPGQHFLPAAEW